MNLLSQITADELLGLRTLVGNLVIAAGMCESHRLGSASCGCDQGTPSDAWTPNVIGRLPPQMCPHVAWSRKARHTWDVEDPLEAECDTCGTRKPAPADAIDECVVARCPSCSGWTMFHSKPDSATAQEWVWFREEFGDLIAREIVHASPGRACDQADGRAARRTCTRATSNHETAGPP